MIDASQFAGLLVTAGFCFRVGWGLAEFLLRPRRPSRPAPEPKLSPAASILRDARSYREALERELGINQPPEKPQPSGGRMIRGDQPPPPHDR